MPKAIKRSALPTLPQVERYGELVLRLGGKHDYKKVKKLGHGYQGASPKSKVYTGIKNSPREAAIALEAKKFKAKYGREPRLPQEDSTTSLPDFGQGEPLKTQPIPSDHSPLLLDRLSAAPQLTISELPVDPRSALPKSPKPLTPPGTVSDGFGNYRPRLADVVVLLKPIYAQALIDAGMPFAMACVFP